jgi:cell division protein FtsQ
VIMIVAGVGPWLLFFSSVSILDVRTVTVTGARQATAGQVMAAARVPLGTPLARLDTAAIERRVATLPPIASAEVIRSWPHAVRIAVRERQLVAVLPADGGYLEIDGNGGHFGVLPAPPPGVPVIQADPLTVTPRMLQSAAGVVRALPPAMVPGVHGVTVTAPDNIVLALQGGITVIWGGAEDSGRKAAVLSALMKQKAKIYDVSAPNAPTVHG